MRNKINLSWIRPLIGWITVLQIPATILAIIHGHHRWDSDDIKQDNSLPFDWSMFWDGYTDIYEYVYIYFFVFAVMIFICWICFASIDDIRDTFK